MKHLSTLFLAASMALTTGQSFAATYNLNMLANSSNNVNTIISVDADEAVDYYYFTDTFNFTIDETIDFSAFALANQNEIDSFGQIVLYDQANTWLAEGDNDAIGNQSIAILNSAWAAGNTVIGPGSYSLVITGWLSEDPDDWSRGLDNATYNLTVSDIAPVPEPSTYALMLAGLGLVGFMARRRKQ